MKNILYILIIALAFTACENEIPFDVKDNPPKLIVNALLEADKSENFITLALTGREKISYIDDAVIDVYLNGELKEHIVSSINTSNNISPGLFRTRLQFSPKDVIKIEVRTNDGAHSAWAEVVVPEPIAIEKIDTMTVTKNTGWGNNKFIRMKTTFTDNGDEKNYYRIVVEKELTLQIKSSITGNDTIVKSSQSEQIIIQEDVVLTDGRPSTNEDNGFLIPIQNKYGVFDNSRINGTYTMITSMSHNNDYYWGVMFGDVKKISSTIKVRLMSLSKMQYFYLKALNIYDSTDYDDFFNLPIKLPSNIEGGTGVVGVSTQSVKVIRLADYVPSLISEEYP